MRVVALLLLAANAASSFTSIAPPPAFYPRLLGSAGAAPALAVVEAPTADTRRLVLVARTDARADTGVPTGAVVAAAPAANSTDLANGFLLRLTDGRLLCAYRHHDGDGAARVFRIALVASADSGATWGAETVVAAGPTGVWEPFLLERGGSVHIFYAAELTNGGEQDIVRRSSDDGGATWSAVDARVHTAGSRNGMPGVAALADGSLFAVFEGFWGPAGWGHFTVNGARSFDGGATWPQRGIVHAPADPSANAGSPQVAVCADAQTVVVVFMSSEAAHRGAAWPDSAHVSLVSATLNASNASAPLAFSSQPATVPTGGDALWPSLFVDAARAGATRAAWQTAAGAAELGGEVC